KERREGCPFTPQRCSSPVTFSRIPRKPSHFGSYCQPSGSGSSSTSSASIGGKGSLGETGEAIAPSNAIEDMNKRVAITGVGVVSPLGNDAKSTWEAAVAGRSGIDYIQAFETDDLPVRIAGEVKDFDPSTVTSPKEAKRLHRNVLFALGAAKEALPPPGGERAH